MKRIYYTLTALLLFSTALTAQTEQYGFTDKQDSLFNSTSAASLRITADDELDSAGLNSRLFSKLINTQFTKVLNSNNGSNLGTFASLDTDESKINYAVTFLPGDIEKGNTAITINLEGSNSDNVLPIFSEDDFARQFGIGFQIHHRILGKTLTYFKNDLDKLQEAEKEVDQNYDKSLREAILDLPYKKKKTELDKWEKEVKSLKDSVDKWDNASEIISLENSVKIEEAIVKIQGLEVRIEERRAELKELDDEGQEDRLTAATASLISDRAKALDKAREEFKITGAKSSWVSYGLSFSNNTFKLFDSSQAFDIQLMDTSFFTKKLNISISQYNDLGGKPRYFLSGGIDFSITDNFSSFSEVNVQSRTDFDSADPNVRFVISDTKAFQSDEAYEQDLKSIILKFDYYKFLFRGKNVAIHLFPRYNSIEGQTDDTLDFGLGIFTSLSKKDEVSSSVNAELFFNFVDLENARDADGDVFDRSVLGLTLNVPIKL
ncbi:hypothetical protein [Ekhidna sp. To15]|uniref:hypothetical protein n=1 Tax=Ekhidna sp. To15 TaxID=3395267 RepID=UPI003F51AD0C